MKKCPYCGKEYPDDATVCALDETLLDQPFFAQDNSPVANRDRERAPYAGFSIRFMARFVDTIFGAAVGAAAGIGAALVLAILDHAGVIAPGWQYRVHGIGGRLFLAGLLGNIAYHTFCEGIHGSTMENCAAVCGSFLKTASRALLWARSFAPWHFI